MRKIEEKKNGKDKKTVAESKKMPSSQYVKQ